ncbi:MAG: tetratricopeptide repeat protein [Chloroflexota bacterium]
MSAGGLLSGAIDPRERDLLERLGLDERATLEDVARTRDELQAFLASAPKSIRGWARRQASAADEAFVLLSDPTASPDPGALPASSGRSAFPPGGPATPPVRRATPANPRADAPAVSGAFAPEGDDDAVFEAMLVEVTPSMHRDRIASRPLAARPVAAAPAIARKGRRAAPTAAPAAALRRRAAVPVPTSGPRRSTQVLAILAGIAVLAVGVVAVYQLGATPGTSGAQATAAPTGPVLDEARVATLMGRIQADPNDTAALLELGDAFFDAEDWATAARWLDKLVTLEPGNIAGRLALGAAHYNIGNDDEAKAQWLAVLELEPDNVEAHYDLGFMYLNQVPPDYAGVQREWGEVVRLDPDSQLAEFVKPHLEALAAQSPSPSAGTSPAASPAASAASSDASAAPTAAPTPAPTAAATANPSPTVAP